MDVAAEIMNGVPYPDQLLARFARIVGGEVRADRAEVKLSFDRSSPDAVRASRATIKMMELELRQLRSEIVQAVQRLNTNFALMKARYPALPKAMLRECQLGVRAVFDNAKRQIDAVLLQLSNIKGALR